MKKITLLFLLSLYCSFAAAQAYGDADTVAVQTVAADMDTVRGAEDAASSNPTTNRWLWGGGLGFSWGSLEWSLHVSPQVGYQVNDYLILGGGVSYSFFRGRGWFDYKANIFAVNGLVQLYPIRNVFVFAQPEVNYQWGNSFGQRLDLDPFFCMPVGAGYVIPLGRRVEMLISLWYDVIQNQYSPYGDKVGYSLGFRFRL